MKKPVSLTLALMLALTALIVPAAADEAVIRNRTGMLTMLNITEEEAVNHVKAITIALSQLVRHGQIDRTINTSKDSVIFDTSVVYYDSLDAMLMALNAGDIDTLAVYWTVAQYLCANHDNLVQTVLRKQPEDTDCAAVEVYQNIVTADFSFMMLEGKEALRDELNAAIAAIKEDGTLSKLEENHIEAAIAGQDIAPVAMPVIEGAETVRVAVTGSLPPMDYIAVGGTPAGFNTALLAEISNRTGKNIELVQVDSVGRAAALSGGTVDVVFWARVNSLADRIVSLTEEEKEAEKAQIDSGIPKEEEAILNQFDLLFSPETAVMDTPEGTIITDAYYSDVYVPVTTKTYLETMNSL